MARQVKSSTAVHKYGAIFRAGATPMQIEMECIRHGGRWLSPHGEEVGAGLFEHFKNFQSMLWPNEKKWHRWNLMELEAYCEHTYIGEMGAAGAGKSDSAASNVLADWFCFPGCTTVLVTSTDIRSLELRVWGILKRYYQAAKRRHYGLLPGYLVEGKQMILASARDPHTEEARDFRNGILGVPVKRGNSFVGLSSVVGIHNKRMRIVADELNLMPRAILDSVANLAKCEDFKLIGLGNPSETTNAHGMLCEPDHSLGGWEGGIDQAPKTKTWKTRFPNGIAIQLPGSDSPNMDVGPYDRPPFPFLITRQQMENDAKIWGVDDWHYTMMNEARMPRGAGSRRILTAQMCRKFRALDQPTWANSQRIQIGALDAAFKGAGGDRCVFMHVTIGEESTTPDGSQLVSNLITQDGGRPKGRQLLALVDTVMIPINNDPGSEEPEEQIVKACRHQCEQRSIIPDNFFYDAGMRTSLVSAFTRNWSTLTNTIDFGGKPSERPVGGGVPSICREYYSKFVTELWYSVRLIVECSQFRGLTDEVMNEGCQREWKMVSGNRIELETKDEMKLKTGRSPDLFDCLATACEGARRLGFVIEKLAPPKQDRKGEAAWRTDLRQRAGAVWRAKELNFGV